LKASDIERSAKPRFLAVGHVTRDQRPGGDVLGGTVAYAAIAAQRLGWETAILTAAGADFDPARELPGITSFVAASRATTRFVNRYDDRGSRSQSVVERAADIDLAVLPDAWRNPEVLLLGPVVGEVAGGMAAAFEADVVGATAQGWLRAIDEDGAVSAREWTHAARDLASVHALFLSESDLPGGAGAVASLLAHVPIVALTRGWQGLTLFTRDAAQDVAALPREAVDATGAGDVLAAALLVRYHECQDVLEAAAFATCAASCVVEAVGTAGIGDRAEILKRLEQREQLIEEGEWDE
jgi:sugar/nucleoside kinase (ribokinase family)